MGDSLNILLGKVEYIEHTVDEDLAPKVKPNEVDHFCKVKIEMKHIKGAGHTIDARIEQGFEKKGSDERVLTIHSGSYFKVEPYDDKFFKKPASNSLIAMIANIVQIAADHNRGMFVIIREDYGMDEALPAPIALNKLKGMIFDDVNKQLLS